MQGLLKTRAKLQRLFGSCFVFIPLFGPLLQLLRLIKKKLLQLLRALLSMFL